MWQTIALLVARLIFAAVFAMATIFKFAGMADTASYIAAAGFPFPLFLAWVAAIFEAVLMICFLTGAYFTEAALLAAVYVVFLGFAFHGPSPLAGQPGRVRLLRQSLHVPGRAAVCGPCMGQARWRCIAA